MDMMGAISELIKVMQRHDARQQALLYHMSRLAFAGTVAVSAPPSSSSPHQYSAVLADDLTPAPALAS